MCVEPVLFSIYGLCAKQIGLYIESLFGVPNETKMWLSWNRTANVLVYLEENFT